MLLILKPLTRNMSSGEELQTIFGRIKSRVKGGSTNYTTLLKLVTARADAEERYGNSLKAIGNDKCEKLRSISRR